MIRVLQRLGIGLALATASLLWPALAAVARADGLDSVPRAVVHLFVIPDQGNVYSTGSGFVINDTGTIITNHHVVDLVVNGSGAIYVMDDQRAREMAPALRDPSVTVDQAVAAAIRGAPTATVVWSDPQKDIAILALQGQAHVSALPLAASDVVHVGDRVVAFGFPGLNLSLGASSLVVLDRRPGEITSEHHESSTNREIYGTSAVTYKGMSGGPAVNACGQVIGINFGGFNNVIKERNQQTQQEEITGFEALKLFIKVDTLLPELDSRSIAYTRVTTRCDPQQSSGGHGGGDTRDTGANGGGSGSSGGSSSGGASSGGGSGAGSSGGTSTGAGSSSGGRGSSSVPSSSSSPSRDPILLVGVLTAIALGLVAVALGLTKRGRQAVKGATESMSRRLATPTPAAANSPARGSGSQAASPVAFPAASPAMQPGASPHGDRHAPSQAVSTPATTPLLYGVSGEYGGVELELGNEPVAIGRDPRVSHLVFSSDTSLVSGRHCAVWFDPGEKSVMVEDLWSTNGTYLGDGRRLEGGRPYPLRSADQFYLGDPDVLFEVRY